MTKSNLGKKEYIWGNGSRMIEWIMAQKAQHVSGSRKLVDDIFYLYAGNRGNRKYGPPNLLCWPYFSLRKDWIVCGPISSVTLVGIDAH